MTDPPSPAAPPGSGSQPPGSGSAPPGPAPPESEPQHEPTAHDPAYFTGLYAADPDPWGFDTRWYEQRKYDLTLAALPRPRYRHGLEPGCANGALTERLAIRCDRLDAFDLIPDVVARARHRLRRHPHVTVTQACFPEHQPAGTGDLLVWSEVGYYLTDAGLAPARSGADHWLEPGGHLIAVHYTGATDYPRTAQAVHRWIDSFPFLSPTVTLDDEQFQLRVWTRTGPPPADHPANRG